MRSRRVVKDVVLLPVDFVALANQTFEHVFGLCIVEGELANFRVSKGKWVYFDLKDEFAKVSCFASIYALPGPLADGIVVRVSGTPRLHPQFGFSMTVQTITPAGEGSIKKAFDLLKEKLIKEGLFSLERKRSLPYPPEKIALVTSIESAAYADFMKIISARWPFIEVTVYDTQVQGDAAPTQLADAISFANRSNGTDVLVITRGGGSADDLSTFNDERVVRAIAASRVPTIVAIGHEIDESLSELAADMRASTPSNAAELLVPDKTSELKQNNLLQIQFAQSVTAYIETAIQNNVFKRQHLQKTALNIVDQALIQNQQKSQLISAYNPNQVLLRGYTLTRSMNKLIKSVNQVKKGNELEVFFADGRVEAKITNVHGKLKK